VEEIGKVFVLARIRADARHDLFVERCLTLEQFVKSLAQEAAQRRCKQREGENQ